MCVRVYMCNSGLITLGLGGGSVSFKIHYYVCVCVCEGVSLT